MRSVLSALLLSSAVAACGGTTNNTTVETTPTANGVFPSSAFAGLELRVEVTGDATDWSTSTTVSFGSGVTVNSVSVASTDDLFADITIDGSAPAGLNDVTITDGGGSDGTLTLSQAFEIDSPEALSILGDVTQGGLPFITIQNLDLLHPFDSTTDANGNFVNTGFMLGTGINIGGLAITDNQITGQLFIDLDAQPSDLVLVRNIGSNQVSVDLGSLAVTTRSPTDASGGSDFSVDIATPGDTGLFSVTSTTEQFVELGSDFGAGSDADANASPFAEPLPTGTWLSPGAFPLLQGSGAAATTPFVVGDVGTDGGYHINVQVRQVDIKTNSTEGSDTLDGSASTTTNIFNDAAGSAASVLPVVFTGSLSSATDVDFIKLNNVPKGKTIRVTNGISSDILLDAAIDIQDAGGTSVISGGGPADAFCVLVDEFFGIPPGPQNPCNNTDTNAPSSATATANFLIEVEPGALFDPAHGDYTLFIEIQ